MVICETIATLGTKNGNIQHSEQIGVHKSGQQNTWDDLSFHKKTDWLTSIIQRQKSFAVLFYRDGDGDDDDDSDDKMGM